MTPQMVQAATVNLKKAGISNFEIRLGEMERMPVADGEVDWIISNCVINLSPEKEKVFAKSFRVLKSGGQILVSEALRRQLTHPPRLGPMQALRLRGRDEEITVYRVEAE